MIFGEGIGGLVLLAVWIYCVIDTIVTPEARCRNLPKLAWIFIVLLLSVIGAALWLVAGRPWSRAATPAGGTGAEAPGARRTGSARFPQARPGQARPRQPGRPSNPDDDEEFLASLAKRAAELRRRAAEERPADPTEPDKA